MYTPLARLIGITTALYLATATGAPALADAPPATTNVWGSSGLILMPTAAVHGFRDYSVGANVLTKSLQPGVVPYVTAGIFEGLEATVLYGVPLAGFSGLSGSAKYQLIRPSRERPTGVAVGLSLLGVNGTDRFVEGNDLYMVISQDINTTLNGAPYTLLTAHVGFEGNLGGSRMMGGVELPLGEHASLMGEYLGPMAGANGFFDVGAVYRPLREWQIRLYTMGNPSGSLTDRDYAVGVSYWGNILGKTDGDGDHAAQVPSPSPRPIARRTHSPRLAPNPTPMPTIALVEPTPGIAPALEPSMVPVIVPTPAPAETIVPPVSGGPASESASPQPGQNATVRGTLMDDKGRPLPGWSVGVGNVDHWTTTDLKGRYALELPMGPYDLIVRDPQGKVMVSKAIRLVTPQGMELPLLVSLPVGELKGMVIDRQTKQGLGDATIQLFRAGETYSFSDRDNGAFYAADLPAGEYRVVVTRSRYQPFEETFSLAARQEKSLVVTLAPKPGSLAGRVTNLKGQGQPGVTVAIPKLGLTTATDRLGAYEFQELPPGQHEVIVTQGQRRVATTLVRVRSDETTTENVTISKVVTTQNKAGTIAGTILDASTHRPLSGVKIVVEGGDLTVLTITGSDGRYAVGDLPPGRYKVTVSRAGFASKQAAASVTAKAGATVNLSLSPGH